MKWTARLALLCNRLPARAKLTGGLAQGLMSATAALIAYLPTKPLGLREGFWGSITAIAVVQSELGATRTSARDQFAGAAIGSLVSALIVTLAGQQLVAVCRRGRAFHARMLAVQRQQRRPLGGIRRNHHRTRAAPRHGGVVDVGVANR